MKNRTEIAVLFLCALLRFALGRLASVVTRLAALFAIVALFAIPADETRAHDDTSATLHAETYPLHDAAKAGHLDSVNHFITIHMADVNEKTPADYPYYGHTPLHFAVRYDHATVAATLIAAGADVNINNSSRNTPLHYAALVTIAAMLIAAGADVNAQVIIGRPRNGTPLHEAVLDGNVPVMSVLLAAGADVNARGLNGHTPLHDATNNHSRVSVVSALLAAGADVNAKDRKGETPLLDTCHCRTFGGCYSINSPDIVCPLSRAAARRVLIMAGGHWGTVCKNAAVVNPANPTPPCLCESPNVGTPDRCKIPSVENCEGLTPSMFYDSVARECLDYKECKMGAILNRTANLCECTGVAVLDVAGTGCLCQSPNVGTPDRCKIPSVENCMGLIPPRFYNSSTGRMRRLSAPVPRNRNPQG